MKLWQRHEERNCVGRCSQSHSDENYGECVVAMHVPKIKKSSMGLNRPVNADAGGKRQQSGFQRRRRNVDHGERRNRAVDECWRRLVLEGADEQQERVSHVLMCGHHVTYVHQVGFGI